MEEGEPMVKKRSTGAVPLSETRDKKERQQWLDALRALAMLLVIVGHQAKGQAVFHLFASPIKLPLFFAISGYLFHGQDKSVPDFAKSLIRRLAVPWLIAVTASVLVQIPFHGLSAVPGEVRSVFVDVTLWYLPCLFFAEILFYITLKVGRTLPAIVTIAIAMGLVGLVLARRHILDAMMLNTACIAQLFMLLGYLIRHCEAPLFRMKWPVIACGVAVYILLGVVGMRLWPGKHIDVHRNVYAFLPHSMAMICVGCTTAAMLFHRIGRFPGLCVFIGQNTLIYYMAHNYVIAAVNRVCKLLGLHMPLVLSITVTTIITCLACALLAVIVNRFLPELAGRRRRSA